MFDISLQDFRGFRQQQLVPIRPITLLIGENSAGKSSFLAALKYSFDFLSQRGPSFNSDPFQLGTFQQISHFRGGRGGRARQFAILLKKNVRIEKDKSSQIHGNFDTFVELLFSNVDSYAALSSIRIQNQSQSLVAAISSGRIAIDFISEKNEKFSLKETRQFPFAPRADLSAYWMYMFNGIRYGMLRDAEEKNDARQLSDEVSHSIERLAALADAIGQRLFGRTVATSAIRTKPQRTYTPGTEKEDGEGSHVPFEIAKLYRSRSKNKSAWDDLKKSVERFGQSSEMFKAMSVKSFGQTVSDPFQIQFSNDGPQTNILDLGYGTSQILPILYSIASAESSARFLIQQPEVHLHPKAQAALGQYIVDAHIAKDINFALETHSDFLVDRVRLAVLEKKIKPDDVSLLFFERRRLENTATFIALDENGLPVNVPEAYRSFFIDEQMRMLGA